MEKAKTMKESLDEWVRLGRPPYFNSDVSTHEKRMSYIQRRFEHLKRYRSYIMNEAIRELNEFKVSYPEFAGAYERRIQEIENDSVV